MIDIILRNLLIDAALVRAESREEKEYSPTDRFKLALNKNLKASGLEPFYSFFAIKRRRAVVIIAAVIAALSLSMSVGAVREKVVNFFVEFFDTFAVILVDKSTEYPKTIEERYAPSYIPEGYVIAASDIDIFENSLTWENKKNERIIFSQTVKTTELFINTEKCVMTVSILSENDGVIWESQGVRSIFFENNEYFFKIISTPEISVDELIKIAKSIKNVEFTKS